MDMINLEILNRYKEARPKGGQVDIGTYEF
jgi:hypothetical protein